MRTFGIKPDTKWLLLGAVCVAVCLPVAIALMAAERLKTDKPPSRVR